MTFTDSEWKTTKPVDRRVRCAYKATYVHVRGKRSSISPNLPFIILLSFLLRDKLNPLTPFRVRRFIMTNISVLNLATIIL